MVRGTPDKYTALIQAAVAVIAANGYDRARMAAIAERAGVGAGTTYLYFKSKPDLLVSVFREKLGQIIRGLEPELAAAADPREQLRRFVCSHFRTLAAEPDFAVLTQIEVRQSDPEIRQQINAVMEEGYFAVLKGVILAGQEQGVFRQDVDWRLIRGMVFGTLDQTVTAWVLAQHKWDLRIQAEAIYQLLATGICTGDQVPLGSGRLQSGPFSAG